MPRKCIFLNVLLTKNSGTYTVLFYSKALKPLSTTSVVQLFLQLLIRCLLSALWQSSTHSHSDGWTQSNLGFGILPRGTLTCRLEEVGIEPPTFGLFKNPTTCSQTRATRITFTQMTGWTASSFSIISCLYSDIHMPVIQEKNKKYKKKTKGFYSLGLWWPWNTTTSLEK